MARNGRERPRMRKEAPAGFEPANGGFAIRCLSRLATAPCGYCSLAMWGSGRPRIARFANIVISLLATTGQVNGCGRTGDRQRQTAGTPPAWPKLATAHRGRRGGWCRPGESAFPAPCRPIAAGACSMNYLRFLRRLGGTLPGVAAAGGISRSKSKARTNLTGGEPNDSSLSW